MGFEFENCCFCVELRTGSLIIGYLSLVGNISLTLLAIMGIAAGSYVMHEGETEDLQTIGMIAVIIFALQLIFIIINLSVNIVLLVGLHKYKRGHVRAYIIYTTIFIVLSIIIFITKVASVSGTTALDIVINLLTIVSNIYYLLVIRSYYLKMDDPSKRPAVYNTA